MVTYVGAPVKRHRLPKPPLRAYGVAMLSRRFVPGLAWALTLAAVPAQTPVALGATVPDLGFLDIRTQRRQLSDLGQHAALVLVFVTKECPMVLRLLPKLERLSREYARKDVLFVGVNVGRNDSIRDMGTQAVVYGQSYPFVRDDQFALLATLGVTRTTTAVVLDAKRTLVYRGRIDDQVRYADVKESAAHDDLRAALDALLAGRKIDPAETPVEGCKVAAAVPPPPSGKTTFHRDVEPVIRARCQGCHHDGGLAPFALLDYDDVSEHADMIGEVVAQQRMPPWHASPSFGTFRNELALSADERHAIDDWLRSGLAKGEPDPKATPREFAKGPWRIGEPDLVLKTPVPTRVPADGIVPYAYLVIPYAFREDTWVEAVEILPENKRVLHHANIAHFRPTEGFSQDGFITGFVPGGDPMELDPGTAMLVPKGSMLGIEAHYVTTGKPETDRIRIGVRFPKVPVRHRAEVLVLTDKRFAIPAGAYAHPVQARRTVAADSTVIGYFAHMHLRGRDMTFTAQRPDAEAQTLLLIPNYDFDWQSSYRPPENTVKLPAGTELAVLAHFDNSRLNPFNPDPSAVVRFGQQTYEEMMYGFVFVTRDATMPDLVVDPKTGIAK